MLKRLSALMQILDARPMAWARRGVLALCVVLLAAVAGSIASPSDAWAQLRQNSDIRNTRHNLSKNAPSTNTVKSTNVDQVCVFCHTPHAASTDPVAKPLWNRSLSTESSYTLYSSTSMDATGLNQPGGSSKLCLSCHDGTIAVGKISVLNGNENPIADMAGTSPCKDGSAGCISVGSGANTGYTRRLGTDLSNDHPISFSYNDTLATKDGELRVPSLSGGLIDDRRIGYHPKLPLENGQMQCTTCHDPHLWDAAETQNNMFLRMNRTQKNNAPTTAFTVSDDIICLACHVKEGYVGSAHADKNVANETYTDAAADARGFKRGTQVWQASCLNCHDTHTVQGARRLLRNGADGVGNAASEQTCYACHSATGNAVLTSVSEVPDIKTEFERTRHMPITTGTTEAHSIGTGAALSGKDGIETQATLADRHVECADCHNPHRVRKSKNGIGAAVVTTSGTHTHDTTAQHSNIISGVLRGSWGVEPRYLSETNNAFGNNPTGFDVKRGDPGESSLTDVDQPYVTREYQICMKCHSNYAYGTLPPTLGVANGSTTGWGYNNSAGAGTQSLTYTNQAMEFQAPSDHVGKATIGGVNNHRSWHPVMRPTGRTVGLRSASSSMWLAPFSGDTKIGTQTIYCSDCHGTAAVSGGGVAPETGKPWGPHGSGNKFILKAGWSTSTGAGASDDLCFRCHDYSRYATKDGGGNSGFSGGGKGSNHHGIHADRIRSGIRCNYCHVAVPHGWKNKALLVNLNAVGLEFGVADANVSGNVYSRAPYYRNAILRVKTWAASGGWADSNCGPTSGTAGKSWMKDTCENAP